MENQVQLVSRPRASLVHYRMSIAFKDAWTRRLPAEEAEIDFFRAEWEQALSGYSVEFIYNVCNAWIRSKPRPPYIADLLGLCKEMSAGEDKPKILIRNTALESEFVSAERKFYEYLQAHASNTFDFKVYRALGDAVSKAMSELMKAGYDENEINRIKEVFYAC